MSDPSPPTPAPPAPSPPARRRFRDGLARTVLPVGILAAGIVAFRVLSVEPPKAKSPPAKPQPIRTQVIELHARDYPVIIRTHGVIRPHSEVTLTPQVAGRIVRIHPGLEDGAFFAEGEVLLELEQADYQTAVAAADAQLARTRAAHALELTRAKQARLNWEDLGYKEEPNELVLRLPQLREAEANVTSAEAQLERARRDLERTRVRAPFAGRVRRRNVGLGQSLGAGTPLAIVFAVDFAEVRLPIAARELPFLALPETARDTPVPVEIRLSGDHDPDTTWVARIVRTEGALDESSLDLFAIARIDDPFGLETGRPPLRIGQPVVGAITGRTLTNVMALPRAAVRQLDQILLVDRSQLTLRTRTILPLWSDETRILVRDPGIPEGGWLSTTRLVYAPDGARVEIIPDIAPAPAGAATNAPARAGSPATSG